MRILAGPLNTVVVGYANGLVGLWDTRDGKRLAHARLHGPVVHLQLEDQMLFAATDLGHHLQWDLSVFSRDYCTLLREVWHEVPVVWSSGRPVAAPPPIKHRCSSKK